MRISYALDISSKRTKTKVTSKINQVKSEHMDYLKKLMMQVFLQMTIIRAANSPRNK